MKTQAPKLCPCGTGQPYTHCCAPFHAGQAAPTALALMRSRYSAYVLRDEAYLRASWDSTTCPQDLGFDSEGAHTHWLGLDIKDHVETGADSAEVEFVARYRIGGGSAVRLHERSRFVRRDGRWYYLDGTHR
jgi:SEC-C motif-containing protein